MGSLGKLLTLLFIISLPLPGLSDSRVPIAALQTHASFLCEDDASQSLCEETTLLELLIAYESVASRGLFAEDIDLGVQPGSIDTYSSDYDDDDIDLGVQPGSIDTYGGIADEIDVGVQPGSVDTYG